LSCWSGEREDKRSLAPRGSQPLLIVGLLKQDTATFVSRTHSRTRRAILSPSFLFGAPSADSIALELVQRRAQQVDRCGACAVADGECAGAHCDGCAVLSVVASRVFRWPQRSRWRAQWGSEWPERLPVLRPLTAPALPKA